MKIIDWPNEVFEIRPPETDSEVFRYNNGLWTPDDGEWDLAFACPDKYRAWYFSPPYYLNAQWKFLTTHWGGRVANHPRGGNAWHYVTANGKDFNRAATWDRYRHLNVIAGDKAMNYVAGKMSGANSEGAELDPANRSIKAGLVRFKATGEIVAIPDDARCIYCGCLITEAI